MLQYIHGQVRSPVQYFSYVQQYVDTVHDPSILFTFHLCWQSNYKAVYGREESYMGRKLETNFYQFINFSLNVRQHQFGYVQHN